MKKLSYKNIYFSLVGIFSAFGIFIISAVKVSAEIPTKYLAADLAAEDLFGIASSYSTILWVVFIALVVSCAGYGIYHFAKKK